MDAIVKSVLEKSGVLAGVDIQSEAALQQLAVDKANRSKLFDRFAPRAGGQFGGQALDVLGSTISGFTPQKGGTTGRKV